MNQFNGDTRSEMSRPSLLQLNNVSGLVVSEVCSKRRTAGPVRFQTAPAVFLSEPDGSDRIMGIDPFNHRFMIQ